MYNILAMYEIGCSISSPILGIVSPFNLTHSDWKYTLFNLLPSLLRSNHIPFFYVKENFLLTADIHNTVSLSHHISVHKVLF